MNKSDSSKLICPSSSVREERKEDSVVLKNSVRTCEENLIYIGTRKVILVFETIINKILFFSEAKMKKNLQTERRRMSMESLPCSQSTAFEDDVDSRVDEQSQLLSDFDNDDDETVEDVSFETEICNRLSILDFLMKLSRILGENHEDYCLFALITLDNLLKSNSQLLLNKSNIYAIIALCFSISIKSNSDIYIANYIVSGLLGCDSNQTIRMELAFLKLMQFKTVISEERFQTYKSNLSDKIASGLL